MEQGTRGHNWRKKISGPPQCGGMKHKETRLREKGDRGHFGQMDEERPKEEKASKR